MPEQGEKFGEGAKGETDLQKEERRAGLAKRRGEVAAGITDPEKKKAFIARQGKQEAKGKPDYADLESEIGFERNVQATGYRPAVRGVASYKEGGDVKKTGPALLHAGETVVKPAEQQDNLGGKRLKSVNVRRATSGGYIVSHKHHAPNDNVNDDEDHIASDEAALAAHLAKHSPQSTPETE